jgi:DNA replication licensing factor MCM7
VEAFVDMRAKDKAKAAASGGRGTLTARQLLSVLRMAQALARLNLRLEVDESDVAEAIRLVTMSKASVMETDDRDNKHDTDPVSRIFALLRDKAMATGQGYVTVEEARALAQRAGFSEAQLEETIAEYASLSILQLNASKTRIDFVGMD